MSTEDVTKNNQLEWKQGRFRSEAGGHFPGPWLLQAEEQMEHWKPHCSMLLRIGESDVLERDTVDQTSEGADG